MKVQTTTVGKNNFGRNVAIVSLSSLVASPVFAAGEAGNPITAAIDAAVTAANGNVTVVVLGVISIAALGFGVGMIIAYLRK
jgi:hypothetical protein